MKTLADTLNSLSRILLHFEGTFSLKNVRGEYFYVNPRWLKNVNKKKEEVLGKRDDQIFDKTTADFIQNKDAEALKKRCCVEYTQHVKLPSLEGDFYVLKGVIMTE